MHFTHEHQELQRNLKRFIDSDINPYVDEWEAAEMFPAKQLFKKMGELGFLGIAKPTEFGGLGLDYSYAMAMAETLGHIHCGGVPMAIGVQTDMATPALARFGSDELRAQFLAPAISGDAVAWCGANVQFNKEGLPRPVVTTVAVRWGGAVLTTLRGLLAHGRGGLSLVGSAEPVWWY